MLHSIVNQETMFGLECLLAKMAVSALFFGEVEIGTWVGARATMHRRGVGSEALFVSKC